MLESKKDATRTAAYLAGEGRGRTILHRSAKQTFYLQGDAADAVFYPQTGSARLTVVSKFGMEATVTHIAAGQFFGEQALHGQAPHRTATAIAITPCTALRIERQEMLRILSGQNHFSAIFLSFLLARSIRIQTDLAEQLVSSPERRLAITLVTLANFSSTAVTKFLAPGTSAATLAGLIGSSASDVTVCLSRFHDLGLVDLSDGIRVHRALLNMLLHDRFPGDNSARPALPGFPFRPGDQPSRCAHASSRARSSTGSE